MPPFDPGASSPASLPLLLAGSRAEALPFATMLKGAGYVAIAAHTGLEAIAHLGRQRFGAIVCAGDLLHGGERHWLHAARELDQDVPVVVLAAQAGADLDSIGTGPLQVVALPIGDAELLELVAQAVLLHQVARVERHHTAGFSLRPLPHRMHSELERRLTAAHGSLWMAYQPIVDWQARRLFGFEALVRSGEPTLATPMALFEGAERLGRLFALGRQIRAQVAADLARDVVPDACSIFVNLHARDLLDSELFDARSPLSQHAHRIVFELTERTALDAVVDAAARVRRLRALGFRIAIDDLGAGFAGLSTFAELEPEVVKLDMSLVRDLPHHPRKRMVVEALVSMCSKLQVQMVAEGVETAPERDLLIEMKCPLLQGYLFGRPQRGFCRPNV